jgi:hypothetical protein
VSQPFTPRPWGAVAADFIANVKRCMLMAVPGMGKTSSVYMVIRALLTLGSNFFPVLVIAPKKVCELTWPAEQKKWDWFKDLKVIPILGEADARNDALLRRGDVYVINYDNVQWLVDKLGKRWPFKIIIADESTKLKSFRLNGKKGKRARALSTIAHGTGRWVNLTGTPIPNGIKDLWGQMWFVDFGARLGTSYTAFANRWLQVCQYSGRVTTKPGAFEEIMALVADCSMSLRSEDWFDVKKPIYMPREVELPPDARRMYDEMERTYFMELGERGIMAPNAAVLSSKLLQIASGAVYDSAKQVHHIHDAKIEGLRSIINELGGEPLLVAYWFKFEVPMLKRAFPEMRFFNDADDEKDWNDGKIELMGIHPASAAHGTNLQYGGRAMAHFTHTWDLELRIQVEERIGPTRQMQSGFDRNVLHYNLIANDTMDVEVLARQAGKLSVQDALMAARARAQGGPSLL